MVNLQLADDLAQRLGALLPPSLADARGDLEKTFRAALQVGLQRLELVTREEFEVQRALLVRTRARLEALDVSAQYTDLNATSTPLCALDIAKLGRLLAQSESFNLYSSLYLDGITHEDDRYTELVNPNRLIRDYPGCTGVSTGSSNTAGHCGVFNVNLTVPAGGGGWRSQQQGALRRSPVRPGLRCRQLFLHTPGPGRRSNPGKRARNQRQPGPG